MKNEFTRLFKSYFNFTKGERNAFIVLTLLIIIVSILPHLFPGERQLNKTDFSEFIALSEQIENKKNKGSDSINSFGRKWINTDIQKRFRFNPNTESIENLQVLGFRPFLAKRIVKYRLSGGVYKSRDDLKRIFGMDTNLLHSLWIYIDLPERMNEKKHDVFTGNSSIGSTKKIIEINEADTTQLIGLPGIGSKLARRIIEFREKLGGFYTWEQLKEIYGLKPETLERIQTFVQVNPEKIRFINLNLATFEVLDNHPYITKNLAKAIIEYRKQHGDFKNVEEIKKILIIDEMLFAKLNNYIKI